MFSALPVGLRDASLGAALAPATAAAACPHGPGPVWVEAAAYGGHDTPVEQHPRASRHAARRVQNDEWPDSYRARGADTVGWYMRLLSIVGTVTNPKPREPCSPRSPASATLAREMTSCARPWLTLNEMQAVQSHEPDVYAQRRFRANVLVLAKALDNRGVRVLLLMPRIPLENTRYRTYWRTLSRYTDYVYEAYTWKTREAIRRTDAGARKYFRDKWTASFKRLKSFTVQPGDIWLMIPYCVNNRNSVRVSSLMRLVSVSRD